jgi:hypothetical protein
MKPDRMKKTETDPTAKDGRPAGGEVALGEMTDSHGKRGQKTNDIEDD